MIEPRNDYVLLESFADECRNAPLNLKSKIIVPNCAKEPSRLSRVVAVGSKVKSVRAGDIVLSLRYGGAESQDAERVKRFFMREEEILCLVT